MLYDRLRGDRDPRELALELRELIADGATVRDTVEAIVAGVRSDGDRAVLDYTRRFDTAGAEPRALRVRAEELDAAADELDQDLTAALEAAIANVRRVGAAWLWDDTTIAFAGHQVVLRNEPLGRAGVYVPGGRAPYPSTVVMGVVTARAAGVAEVAVCAPPGHGGDIDNVVLAACRLAGADVVYRMGGAQAIAAMAYGTDTVQAVDVIVGPGNLFVQEAKRQVSGEVGIDGFAGPSDLVVIAEGGADAEALALDMVAQAEHGANTLVVAISDDATLLSAIEQQIAGAPDSDAVARLVQVRDLGYAVELAQALAPEHIQLVGPRAERLAGAITHAGCVFVGAAAGTAFGDYIAGSNHILPTGGAARFASALSPAHFRRSFTEVRIADGSELARRAAPLARAEGFEFHARSMEARIRDNGSR